MCIGLEQAAPDCLPVSAKMLPAERRLVDTPSSTRKAARPAPRSPAAEGPRGAATSGAGADDRSCCTATYRPAGGSDGEHAAEYPAVPSRSRYSYRMISPIRGDFTGFRVQVPPRTHMQLPDLRLSACRMGRRATPQVTAVGLKSLSDTCLRDNPCTCPKLHKVEEVVTATRPHRRPPRLTARRGYSLETVCSLSVMNSSRAGWPCSVAAMPRLSAATMSPGSVIRSP
jgi:hypothetical protein